MMVEDMVSRFIGLFLSSPMLALIMAWSGWCRPKGMGWPPMCSRWRASMAGLAMVGGVHTDSIWKVK